ncbi:MAG TPA: ornithine carbamoyltransferase [Candidatus Aminicenantes bacterium]|nr:ornithine carbamoyltransferase [Candidatus Aminicenantes bacterium]HRY64125.1 ornithine carbamoyltransferase [Candidatus Aminicenantes bacterium]HRZ71038.1 ornithine carbamoyltransferase [Candidatus Aminicenantes bacterium]
MQKDFLSIRDLSVYEFGQMLDKAAEVKKHPAKYRRALKGKILAMIFQKPSLRTRMTFETGMLRLGGEAIYLAPSDISLGSREGAFDIGKNLERWVDGIMIRTFGHQIAVDLAAAARIPVINALTDLSHPCQAMADFLTLREHKGALSTLKLTYVGDGNNVCHSLMLAAARGGTRMAVATPPGYEPKAEVVAAARQDGRDTGFELTLTSSPEEAVAGADAVYTDVWASMGQESEKEARARIFAPYQVNAKLMAQAKPGALFLHCLPAHRGDEVTDEVIDAPYSVVYDEAENRLHAQKAILIALMGDKD